MSLVETVLLVDIYGTVQYAILISRLNFYYREAFISKGFESRLFASSALV